MQDRATADPVEFPTDNIISGVDGVHGGTWLGFNRKTGKQQRWVFAKGVSFSALVPQECWLQ